MCLTSCIAKCPKRNGSQKQFNDSQAGNPLFTGKEDLMTDKSSDPGLAKTLVQSLTAKGIRLLALDFDKTIVSVHTAGYWRQGTPKLVEQVRPCFKDLIQAALETTPRLHLAVVTYSMQPVLIRDVLRFALPTRLRHNYIHIIYIKLC